MKNVEGWEVGTLYGEPIYKTKDPDYLIEPRIREYYIHNNWSDAAKRVNCRHWSQVSVIYSNTTISTICFIQNNILTIQSKCKSL